MGSKNRKPKINKRPSQKGMKKFMAQGLKSIKRALRGAAGPSRPDQWWHSTEASRAQWLMRGNRSKYRPHQGIQEKQRRVRQKRNLALKQIEAWPEFKDEHFSL